MAAPTTSMMSRRNRATRERESDHYIEPPTVVLMLFLVYVLYMYLQGGVRWPILGQMRLEFLLGAVLVPIAVATVSRQSDYRERSLVGWTYALLGSMLVMVVLSRYPEHSWDVFWNRGVKFAAFGLCIVAFVSSPRNLRWFVLAFLLAFFKMGLEGLLGTLDGSLIWENQEIPRLHGATPSYQHPNSFSGTQLGILPFLYYLYPLVSKYWRLAILIQVIFCANVVLRTGSRTGYLGFLAGVASAVWMSKARLKSAVVVGLLALAVIPMLPADYVERFESIFENQSHAGEDTSIGKRKEILVDATEVFLRYPLGVGVGAFPLVRNDIFGRQQDTHNLYLEVATNLGVQGSIAFVGFVISIWVTLARLRRRLDLHLSTLGSLSLQSHEVIEHEKDLRWMLACVKATLIFLIIRLVLGGFGMDMYEIYWWFMLGMTIALLRMTAVAERKTMKFAQLEGKAIDYSVFGDTARRRRIRPGGRPRTDALDTR